MDGRLVASLQEINSKELLDLDHVDLDELAVKRLWGWRDAGHHELLKVRNQSSILPVAVKGDRRSAVDFDRLGVVNREDLCPTLSWRLRK